MGKGGEVLALDMGEPVRIVDLARDLIRLSGADPDRIPIVFTGLRPGEKLFEEPLASGETTLATPHPKLFIAQARHSGREAVEQMVAWLERDRAATDNEVRAWLKSWVPEYAWPGSVTPIAAAEPVPLRARRASSIGD
jgi:FlaA1/EpsC-like NDP-sugar epimerase